MTKRIAGVKLTVADQSDKLVAKAVDLFTRRWKERTRVPLKSGATAAWELAVGTLNQPEILAAIEAAGLKISNRPQSYAIVASGRTLTVCGADGNGVLYGLGYLLRQLEFESNRVPLPSLREARTPAVYNRGVYFASHFNNYYEAAPMEEIERYIEEMALWGFDMLAFWFDGNWFPNNFWKDPNSRGSRMAKRLRRIGEVARACGLKVTSLGIGNEGFYNLPPPSLRADPSARHGGFYMNSQICPSQPGGLKMILEVRRKILELIGPIEAFTIWPYDQGGCGCAPCTHAPGRWGKKFLEIAPLLAQLVREVNPNSQVFISTWLMDETERKMVYELCDQNPGWFQGVMTEVDHATERKLDARYERLVFPEISMFDCYFCSYGCNGANPAPQRFARDAAAVARSGSGTALYSEGCYEDINKIVYASLLWNPDRDVAGVLAEYTRYYFGKANMKVATELIRDLETTWGAAALLKAEAKTVSALAKKAQSLKSRGPRHRDAQLRWQMLNDRANIDWLMKQPRPWKELVVENRNLYEILGYAKGSELRPKIKKLHAALQLRQKQVKQLFEAHWNYMKYFHMENTCLIFLPDDVLGKYNFDPLAESLGKALKLRDEEEMRAETSRAFKHWFWFNGIDYKYLFD